MPGIYHTFPVNDLIEHDTSAETGDECTCGPTTEPIQRADGSYGWHILHYSLDGRELNERQPR